MSVSADQVIAAVHFTNERLVGHEVFYKPFTCSVPLRKLRGRIFQLYWALRRDTAHLPVTPLDDDSVFTRSKEVFR
jgi:hypothetical protein